MGPSYETMAVSQEALSSSAPPVNLSSLSNSRVAPPLPEESCDLLPATLNSILQPAAREYSRSGTLSSEDATVCCVGLARRRLKAIKKKHIHLPLAGPQAVSRLQSEASEQDHLTLAAARQPHRSSLKPRRKRHDTPAPGRVQSEESHEPPMQGVIPPAVSGSSADLWREQPEASSAAAAGGVLPQDATAVSCRSFHPLSLATRSTMTALRGRHGGKKKGSADKTSRQQCSTIPMTLSHSSSVPSLSVTTAVATCLPPISSAAATRKLPPRSPSGTLVPPPGTLVDLSPSPSLPPSPHLPFSSSPSPSSCVPLLPSRNLHLGTEAAAAQEALASVGPRTGDRHRANGGVSAPRRAKTEPRPGSLLRKSSERKIPAGRLLSSAASPVGSTNADAATAAGRLPESDRPLTTAAAMAPHGGLLAQQRPRGGRPPQLPPLQLSSTAAGEISPGPSTGSQQSVSPLPQGETPPADAQDGNTARNTTSPAIPAGRVIRTSRSFKHNEARTLSPLADPPSSGGSHRRVAVIQRSTSARHRPTRSMFDDGERYAKALGMPGSTEGGAALSPLGAHGYSPLSTVQFLPSFAERRAAVERAATKKVDSSAVALSSIDRGDSHGASGSKLGSASATRSKGLAGSRARRSRRLYKRTLSEGGGASFDAMLMQSLHHSPRGLPEIEERNGEWTEACGGRSRTGGEASETVVSGQWNVEPEDANEGTVQLPLPAADERPVSGGHRGGRRRALRKAATLHDSLGGMPQSGSVGRRGARILHRQLSDTAGGSEKSADVLAVGAPSRAGPGSPLEQQWPLLESPRGTTDMRLHFKSPGRKVHRTDRAEAGTQGPLKGGTIRKQAKPPIAKQYVPSLQQGAAERVVNGSLKEHSAAVMAAWGALEDKAALPPTARPRSAHGRYLKAHRDSQYGLPEELEVVETELQLKQTRNTVERCRSTDGPCVVPELISTPSLT